MLANLYLSWQVMFPILFMLAVGIFCRKAGFLDDAGVSVITRLVFHFFLPTTVFLNIYNGDISQLFSREMILLAGLGASTILVPALLCNLYYAHRPREIADSAVITQAIFRGNGVIFALPIVTALCGSDQLGTMALLILFCSPLNNILGVLFLSPIRQGKANLVGTLKALMKNPMILGSLSALFLLVTNLKLPALMVSTLTGFSAATTPLSFVMLGASLHLSSFTKDARLLGTVSFIRLVVMPGVTLAVAVALGYRGVPLASLLAIITAPTAVSSFAMAKAYGGNGELAAELVAVTTLFAGLTVFLWIALAGYWGLI